MDVQDHSKTPSSAGHESHGVHLCHKCGWPFPNPHPSAKHRRAHKRVCGKVEGYKILDSETEHFSDDEHPSDDDMKTPSSGISNEAARNLMNQSDSKPASDFRVEEVSSGVDRTEGPQVNSCSSVSESILENITTDAECGKQNELISSGPRTDKEVRESVNEVESFTQSVAPLDKSASDAPLCESKSEEAEVVLETMIPEAERKTSETGATEPKLHEADENISHTVTVGKIIEQEEELNNKLQAEVEIVNLEPTLQKAEEKVATVSTVGEDVEQEELINVLEAEKAEVEIVNLEPTLQEADEKVATVSTVGEDVEQEELINVLEAEKTKHDLSPPIEPPKSTDASVTTLVEADSAEDTKGTSRDELTEVYDSNVGGDKETHLLSVTETLPATENPEVMIGEFKDYEVFKSSFPLDLGTAEVTSSVKDDNKLNMSEPEPSSISSIPDGSLQSYTSDFNSLEHRLEKEGILASMTGEIDTSGPRMISGEASGTNDVEGSPGTSGFETHNNQTSLEGFQPNATDEEPLQNDVSVPSTMAHSDVIPAVSSIDEETYKETTGSSKVVDADGNVVKESDLVRTENGTSHLLDEDNTSSAQKCTDEVFVDASQGLEKGNNDEVPRSGSALCVVSETSLIDHSVASGKESEKSNETEAQKSVGAVSQVIPEDHSVVSDKNPEGSSSMQPLAFAIPSDISSQSSAADKAGNTRDAIISEPWLDEGGDKLNFNVSAVDITSSRNESLDGNWGSVSVLSTQSDGTTPGDAEMLSLTGSRAPEKSESTLLNQQTAAGDSHHDKSDAFEPPSFMTLVESGTGADKNVATSETNTVGKAEQPSEALQSGWFPSLANVVNESEGRKKNEEIIAKVTNWSTGKQHSPLKNLLSEAQEESKVKVAATQKQVPDVNQADETGSKNNGAAVTTVSLIMGSETPNNNAGKREVAKEWNSPARYPTEIKKEKKKGKPYWVPFVCCTSVHQDM
ncbi:hypothetical protein ACH5RR_031901 [Cinchona calisaya]|uniref:C2H2-type domain-containing protein n=1 Tax=Cinchona calisaya TaxID=153742 RepID=A0ABD2YGJ2_9GENT